jgi:hypothetical protein
LVGASHHARRRSCRSVDNLRRFSRISRYSAPAPRTAHHDMHLLSQRSPSTGRRWPTSTQLRMERLDRHSNPAGLTRGRRRHLPRRISRSDTAPRAGRPRAVARLTIPRGSRSDDTHADTCGSRRIRERRSGATFRAPPVGSREVGLNRTEHRFSHETGSSCNLVGDQAGTGACGYTSNG